MQERWKVIPLAACLFFEGMYAFGQTQEYTIDVKKEIEQLNLNYARKRAFD